MAVFMGIVTAALSGGFVGGFLASGTLSAREALGYVADEELEETVYKGMLL